MHQEQSEFIQRVKARFPHWFVSRSVLDCGSRDINGNNREFFAACQYTGIDIVPGPNVDTVTRIHEFQGGLYDTIICTEAFEHDEHFQESITHMINMLGTGGVLIFTCATIGRAEHGTAANKPEDSPGTLAHYRNIPADEMAAILGAAFRCWVIEVHHGDLYGWGTDKW